MADLRRRDFLIRGGSFGGAVLVAAVTGPATLQRAMAASPTLSDSQRQTYTAIVEALTADRVSGLDTSNIAVAGHTFTTYYEKQESAWQDAVRTVLDAVDSGPATQRFEEADIPARLDMLRKWQYGPDEYLRLGGNKAPMTAAQREEPDPPGDIPANARAVAGEIDPHTHVRTVKLKRAYRPTPYDGAIDDTARRRCDFAVAVGKWAVIPFQPPTTDPEAIQPSPVIDL